MPRTHCIMTDTQIQARHNPFVMGQLSRPQLTAVQGAGSASIRQVEAPPYTRTHKPQPHVTPIFTFPH